MDKGGGKSMQPPVLRGTLGVEDANMLSDALPDHPKRAAEAAADGDVNNPYKTEVE